MPRNEVVISVLTIFLTLLSGCGVMQKVADSTEGISRQKSVSNEDLIAFYWYKKAAEHGVAEAQFNLALMYEKGQGVPQDYEKAFHWYQQAAEQGFPAAQHNLGIIYYKGQGVPQDYQKAYQWFSLSANQGDKGAILLIDLALLKLKASQINAADEWIKNWKPKK